MQEIILVKLGGSIITDKAKPYTLRSKVLQRLAKELTTSPYPLIISHGAGSFAHTSAQKYGGMQGYTNTLGLATVAKDALSLNTIVVNALIQVGIPALPFRSLNTVITREGTIQESFFCPLIEALRQGFIPVVYGDVLLDASWKSTIYSGEKILGEIAAYLLQRNYQIHSVIEVGITDGVYTQKHLRIPTITQTSWPKVVKEITKGHSPDVTGGMQHKIEEALLLTERNITTNIINGLRIHELSKALNNISTKGTLITS